jgi:hypothetical protein
MRQVLLVFAQLSAPKSALPISSPNILAAFNFGLRASGSEPNVRRLAFASISSVRFFTAAMASSIALLIFSSVGLGEEVLRPFLISSSAWSFFLRKSVMVWPSSIDGLLQLRIADVGVLGLQLHVRAGSPRPSEPSGGCESWGYPWVSAGPQPPCAGS